jgi:hypothetical protein
MPPSLPGTQNLVSFDWPMSIGGSKATCAGASAPEPTLTTEKRSGTQDEAIEAIWQQQLAAQFRQLFHQQVHTTFAKSLWFTLPC